MEQDVVHGPVQLVAGVVVAEADDDVGIAGQLRGQVEGLGGRAAIVGVGLAPDVGPWATRAAAADIHVAGFGAVAGVPVEVGLEGQFNRGVVREVQYGRPHLDVHGHLGVEAAVRDGHAIGPAGEVGDRAGIVEAPFGPDTVREGPSGRQAAGRERLVDEIGGRLAAHATVAGVADPVPVGVGLRGIIRADAVFRRVVYAVAVGVHGTRVADAVVVGVLLVRVGRDGAIVQFVGHAVVVIVVVAGVALAVVVVVFLQRVVGIRAIVGGVGDPVAVAIVVAGVAVSVAVQVGLVGVVRGRTVVVFVLDPVIIGVEVARIADPVAVGVHLVRVDRVGAVVGGVEHAVAVNIGVAGVAEAVVVGVALDRVPVGRAIVVGVEEAVRIGIPVGKYQQARGLVGIDRAGRHGGHYPVGGGAPDVVRRLKRGVGGGVGSYNVEIVVGGGIHIGADGPRVVHRHIAGAGPGNGVQDVVGGVIKDHAVRAVLNAAGQDEVRVGDVVAILADHDEPHGVAVGVRDPVVGNREGGEREFPEDAVFRIGAVIVADLAIL